MQNSRFSVLYDVVFKRQNSFDDESSWIWKKTFRLYFCRQMAKHFRPFLLFVLLTTEYLTSTNKDNQKLSDVVQTYTQSYQIFLYIGIVTLLIFWPHTLT